MGEGLECCNRRLVDRSWRRWWLPSHEEEGMVLSECADDGTHDMCRGRGGGLTEAMLELTRGLGLVITACWIKRLVAVSLTVTKAMKREEMMSVGSVAAVGSVTNVETDGYNWGER